MVRKIINLILVCGAFALSGCSQKNNEEAPVSVQNIPKPKLSDNERKILYRGDYEVEYKEPRVVWFKPMLTNKGNVVSERTITLAPKEMKWGQVEKTNMGSKFNELVGE